MSPFGDLNIIMDMVDDAMNEIDAVHIWVTYLAVGALVDILVVQRTEGSV